MNPLIHNLVNQVLHSNNQFASGGLLLMAVGGFLAYLRNIPIKIWKWVVHQTTVSLTVTDDHKAYYWVKAWFEQQRLTKRIRHMDVYSQGAEKYVLVPAPGHHWMLYKGRIISVLFSRSDEKKMESVSWLGARRQESLMFTTIGRKQKIFRTLMNDVRDTFVRQEEKKPELYAWGNWGEWLTIHAYQPRSLDSVVIPEGKKEEIVRDIEAFKASREWYRDMGIPYRKGYGFYGLPGTGKTSLVMGLSSHFKANVYILKLGDMTDTTLVEAVKTVEPNSFLIVEDIDSVSSSHRRTKSKTGVVKKDEKGVSLSGLLNVLDGLLSPVGGIFIITTNHPEKLDPALTRPGRIDLELNMDYATEGQKREMYRRFFQDEFPAEFLTRKLTMADMQQELMAQRVNGKAN